MLSRLLLRSVGIAILFVALSQSAFAQKTVTGKITDSKDGSPVVGASVTAKGTGVGTQTKTDGTFSITVPANATTLVISSVGYATQEVNITGQTSADILLVASSANLNEVVVVGYGTAKRKDLTGSVSSVQAKDFNKGITTAPDQLIQGKVPGVQILNNNGAPGAGSTIRIRGANSIRSGNNPLFVIDGVPFDYISAESGFGSAVGNTPGSNPLNFMNPADIASIDVLKDASAAAIYGSRGANGVVIITTKRALSGEPSLEVSSSIGMSKIMRQIDILSGDEYRAALTKYGLTSGNFGTSVNALDEILRTGILQNYSVALGGGSENARYRFSSSYQNEQGIVKETGFKKYTGSFTGAFKFLNTRKLGLDIRLLPSHTTNQLGPVTNDAGFQQSVIGTALQWNPTHALRKPNDSIWVVDPLLGNSTINPLAMLEAWDVIENVDAIVGNIQPYFKFNNHLEYRMLYGLVHEVGVTKGSIARWLNQQNIEGHGIAGIFNRHLTSHQITHTLNYNGNISSGLSLNGLLGYEYRKTDIGGSGMTGQDFQDNGISYYDQLQASSPTNRNIWSYADPIQYLQSFFGRTAFNLRDKYHLTATLRVDGSSKFGKNNKYGVFPSFGGAWTLSNEDFIHNVSFINYLKLRVGWGITGNQEFPGGAALESFVIESGGGTRPDNLPNPNLKWEKVVTTNAALDFNVWDDRLTGSIEYFNKITTDPLIRVTVAAPGPANLRYWKNLDAEVHNSGVEVGLNAGILKQKDLNWNFGVNATFLKNKVTNLGEAIYETGGLHGQGISGASAQRVVNNYPLNVYYLRIWEGIDKGSGQSIYKDDGYSRYYVGDPNPDVLLGISTDITYKKLALYVNMSGAFGHQLYNNTANSVLPIGNLGTRNIAADLMTLDPKPDVSDPITPSTRYMEKGDYLKLTNATISYRLGNIHGIFRNAVISVTGQNLFVITDFSGFDPEVNVDKSIDGVPSYGIEYTPYPTARKFILGINFSL